MAGLQGRVLGGYQLAAQLSSGGVAEVYRATPTQPGAREAVIKVIYPEFARQSGFRARFDQIVQIGRRLNHPHILPLLASGEQNGYLYIVTPFVAAGTLKDWIVGGRRLGTHDVGPFFRQVCEAVGYAHSQSVAHGNIKPSNIFLFEGRHVLLGDFGRLWDIGQMDMTHAGPGIEAVEFLAPETTEGRTDQRSDIYGLGAVLFASLTGAPPFRGSTPFEVLGQHARQAPPQLASARPPVEPGVLALDPVIQRALAKAPDARYPSALALAQAVESAARGAPLAASGPPRAASPLGAADPALGRASFPPLPAGLVDPGMEEGRFALSQPTAPVPPTPRLGAPPPYQLGSGARPPATGGVMGGIDLFSQPTERVVALGDSAAANTPGATNSGGGMTPFPGSFGGAAAGAGGANPDFGGFIVAGGLAQPESSSNGSGQRGLPIPDLPDFPAAFGPMDADHTAGDLRSFSPTRLGLPRLTMNELDGMPAEWQELLSDPMPGPDTGSQPEGGRWDVPNRGWDAEAGRDEGDHRGAEPRRGGESQAWGESNEDSQAYSAAQRAWSGTDSQQAEVPDLYASSSLEALPGGRDPNRIGWSVGPDASWGQSGVAEREEDEGPPTGHDPFDDPSAWARRKQPRHRWNPRDKLPRGREVRFRPKTKARPLMMLLVLLLVLDGGLVAGVRPDLCPRNACGAVHAKLVQYLPVLSKLQAAFIVPLTATPSKATVTVAAGSSASMPLKLTNTSHQVVGWSARSGLPWLTINAASTSLDPVSIVTITLSVKPAAALAPGTYNTTVVFTVGLASLTVPVQINVTPHH
jgi:hypothetical protein